LLPASQAVGEIIPIEECRRMVLYSSIQAATLVLAAAIVGKSSRERSSNSSVEWNDSITALSRAEPGRPIDWRMLFDVDLGEGGDSSLRDVMLTLIRQSVGSAADISEYRVRVSDLGNGEVVEEFGVTGGTHG